jgi:SEC-C motif
MKSGSINIYRCRANGHETITVDRVEGTTPVAICCPSCDSDAYSAWYKCDQTLVPTHEWYKPELKEYRTLNASGRDHVDAGGLLLRKIGSEENGEAVPLIKKVGRNELCPCGSGLKYKKCKHEKFESK